MKVLEILEALNKHGAITCSQKRTQEAIVELEELVKPKTCDECKHNYLIDNFDSFDGKRLDSFSPNECYICSRNCNDMYEPKV